MLDVWTFTFTLVARREISSRLFFSNEATIICGIIYACIAGGTVVPDSKGKNLSFPPTSISCNRTHDNRAEISQTREGEGYPDCEKQDDTGTYTRERRCRARATAIQDGGGRIVLDEEDEGRTELNGERS
jgi:hypothetical protein